MLDEASVYELTFEERPGQSARLTAEEFKSSAAVKINRPSNAFLAMVKQAKGQDDDADEAVPNPLRSNAVPDPQLVPLPKSIYASILSIIAIMAGIFTVFFGQKRFKWVMFIFGAGLFGIMIFWLVSELKNRGQISRDANLTLIYMLAISLGCIVGGVIFIFLASLASYLLGAFTGFLAGCFLLEIPSLAVLSIPVRIAIIGGLGVAGLVLAAYFKKPVLFLSTSFLGSFCIFAGLDYWIGTGYISVVDVSLSRHFVNGATIAMISGFVLVALIGTAVQVRDDRLEQASLSLPTYSRLASKESLGKLKKLDPTPSAHHDEVDRIYEKYKQ
ncbi:hypothetical protein HDU91_004362 [Kappamyces sp. JEL0680]|nr:hypothetical protein HDU91_004362 [Kappamyces sp. JEL0680]